MIHFLRRYTRLYAVFARNNLVREMEFRANFFAKFGTNIAWLFSFILFLKIIFHNTTAIAGWSEGDVFLLFGTFIFVRSLMDILFTQNIGKLPELIRMGTMDFVLTKPVPSLFFVSTRYLSLDEFGSLFGAVGVLIYAHGLLHNSVSVGQGFAWGFLVLCGLVTLYAVQMLLMTLSFWLIRLDNLTALTETIIFMGRYPPDIFGKYLALFITYIVPLAFIAAVPTLALKEGVRTYWLIAGLSVSFVFLSLATLFWNYATRAYTSASS